MGSVISLPWNKSLLLELLENLPVEIFLEILSHFQPLDLLHFSHVGFPKPSISKKHSNSPSLEYYRPSAVEWRKTFANVPGLPPPPENMPPAAYTRMMFVKVCHECNRNCGKIKIIWSARMRLCTQCVQKLFVEHWKVRQSISYPAELSRLLPTLETKSKILYCTTFAEKWQIEYTNAPNQDEWVANKISAREHIIESDPVYEAWFEGLEERRKSEIEARRELVIQYLGSKGWADEITKMNEDDFKMLKNHKCVTNACQKELTTRSYNALTLKLVPLLEDTRSRRLKEERTTVLWQRLVVVDQALHLYISYLPSNSLYPSLADLFFHPQIQAIFHQAPPAELLTPDNFAVSPQLALLWQKDVERQLCEIVLSALPGFPVHRGILDLAAISFKCLECHCRGPDLTYPRVLMHECARVSEEELEGQSEEDEIVRSMSNSVRWNAKGNIVFDLQVYRTTSAILETVHLHPSVTTRTDMDALGLCFMCISCNDPHVGRPTMTWSRLVFHLLTKPQGQVQGHNFVQLSWEAAADFMKLVEGHQQRQRAQRDYQGMVCVICKQVGNSVQLIDHVASVHGVRCPTSEHIAPLLDLSSTPPVFMLWPPLRTNPRLLLR